MALTYKNGVFYDNGVAVSGLAPQADRGANLPSGLATPTITTKTPTTAYAGGGLPSNLGGSVPTAPATVPKTPTTNLSGMVKYGNQWGIDPATVPASLSADWNAVMNGGATAGNLVKINNWVYNGTLPTAPATTAPHVPTAEESAAAMTRAGIPTEYQTPNNPAASGGGLPASLGGSVPTFPTTPAIPGNTGGTTPPASTPPGEYQDPYADVFAQLLNALQGMGVESQGSNEPFLPSSSTSELSQALQDRAMQMLNRPYGYTPEEEAAIADRTLNRFNANQESDLNRLESAYEQYGWNTGAPELGGQARGSMNEYYKNRGLALSDLMGGLTEQFLNKRTVDEQAALAGAMGINDQIYGQQRGDFADMLALMGFNEDQINNELNRVLAVNGQQWQQNLESQNLADSGLWNWMNYVNENTVLPSQYQNALSNMDSAEMGMVNDAMRSYLGEGGALTQMLPILAMMMMDGGNGTTVNVGNSGGIPDAITDAAGSLVDKAVDLGKGVGGTAGAILSGLGDKIASGAVAAGGVLPALGGAVILGAAIYNMSKASYPSNGGMSREILKGSGLENDPIAKYITFTASQNDLIQGSRESQNAIMSNAITLAKTYGPAMRTAPTYMDKLQLFGKAVNEFSTSQDFLNLSIRPGDRTYTDSYDPQIDIDERADEDFRKAVMKAYSDMFWTIANTDDASLKSY